MLNRHFHYLEFKLICNIIKPAFNICFIIEMACILENRQNTRNRSELYANDKIYLSCYLLLSLSNNLIEIFENTIVHSVSANNLHKWPPITSNTSMRLYCYSVFRIAKQTDSPAHFISFEYWMSTEGPSVWSPLSFFFSGQQIMRFIWLATHH